MRKKRIFESGKDLSEEDDDIADVRSSQFALPPDGFGGLPLELYYQILSHLPLPTLFTLRSVSRDHARLVAQFIEQGFRRGDYVLEVTIYESPLGQEERRELRKQRRRAGQSSGNSGSDHHHHQQVVESEPNSRRRDNPPVGYWCPDFTLTHGARLEFFPISNPMSSGSSSGGNSDDGIHPPKPGDIHTTPVQSNPPVAGTESHSSASSSSRDLERQFTRIKLRFKDPANTSSNGSLGRDDPSSGLWTEAEQRDALSQSPFISSSTHVPRTFPPSFSVTFPFHPSTRLGSHVWNRHKHSSVEISYTVEDQGSGSYSLVIRSVNVRWAWLSGKITGTKSVERRNSAPSPSPSSPSPSSSSRTSVPTLNFPVYTCADPIGSVTTSPSHLTAPDPTIGLLVTSSPSLSSSGDSSSLVYSSDTGSELWDTSDREEGGSHMLV